jgi:putative aldouronate transport system permease protein
VRSNKASLAYHSMMVPGMLLLLIFSLLPMSGIVIAFEQFYPAKGIWGSKWVGLANFRYMFMLPDSLQVFTNTLVIAVIKIIAQLAFPVVVSLMLNEINKKPFKRMVQTVIYLPHFLSWVILGGIVSNMLSLDGIINTAIQRMGNDPIIFLASNAWFRTVIIVSDVWKEFGFGTVIYLAAMTAIDGSLYEAAAVDGANRWQRLWYITLPHILPTIILMGTLSLGTILNAGFEQILNLYNPLVYQTGDIIDTYVYRTGLINAQYGLATAVGLFKSVISFALITASYKLADVTVHYRIL